jgi:DNA-binding CsgD family transcriptional regulator
MRRSAARASDVRAPSSQSPLVEREGEVGALAHALRRAREGRGSVAVIEGAFGLGKTRLLMEGRRLAAQEGMEVLSATARGLERHFSLGVARQLLEGRVARTRTAERKRLFAGPAQLAAPVLLEGLYGSEPSKAGKPSLFVAHGLYWLCSNLATARPLMLVVDDAEWADEASLRCLLYLAQRIRLLPAVLVVAAGAGDPRPTLLRELLAHPASTVLRLRPLRAEAVARHLRESLFPHPDAAFADALHRATAGNPFLLNELLAELPHAGLQPTRAAVDAVARLAPTSIAEAVLLRLRWAGAGAVELARAVAVLGEAELRHAAALAQLDQPEAARLAHSLVEAGIFRCEELLSFAQPVVRAAIHAQASEVERAEHHLRAAHMLDREGAAAEEIALHLLEARRAGDARTVELLSKAAAHSLAEGAPDAAVGFLRRALREPPPADARPRVLLELGRAEAVAGEAAAPERLSEAAELIDDPRERALTALDIGRILHAQGRQGDAVRALERGLSELGGGDDQLHVLLRSARAVAMGTSLSKEELKRVARDHGREQNGIARTPMGRVLLAHLAFEQALRGDDACEVRSRARRALAGGALLDDETSDGVDYYRAVAALVMVEDLLTAELALTAAIEDARARGSVFGFATACYFRAWAVLRRGRVDDAAADAQNALAAGRHGWRLALPGTHGVLAEAFIERADLARAAREIALSAELGHGAVEHSVALYLAATGHVRLLEGRPVEALDAYIDCGRRLVERGAPGAGLVAWRSGAARAGAALGDTVEAHRLLSEELDRARSFGVVGTVGRALHAMGSAYEGGDALGYLAEAVDVFERSEAVLDRARALVDFGAALRRAGKRRQSRDHLLQGLELAEGCRARALAQRARAEISAAGGRPRRTALSGLEALTPREYQVAGLAAQGMSNREIAEALFVTVKTIEWHLRHAYDKLGVGSRRELGAVLAGRAPARPMT